MSSVMIVCLRSPKIYFAAFKGETLVAFLLFLCLSSSFFFCLVESLTYVGKPLIQKWNFEEIE